MGVGLGNLPRAGNDFRPIRVGSLPESEEPGVSSNLPALMKYHDNNREDEGAGT